MNIIQSICVCETCGNPPVIPPLMLPKAYSERGADMGRRNQLPDVTDAPVRLRLQRMRMVDGDYDQGGAYWGANINGKIGDMYAAWGEWDKQVRVFVRAHDREEAKTKVLALLPRAEFFQ
jgi:hypothetical protein